MNRVLCEVELVKAQIEHKKTINVFKTQNSDCWYSPTMFFIKLCDVNKFEELEMGTDSLYLAFAEKEWEYCIRPEMKPEWERL